MKTWEMIKELSENSKKKFKRKTDGLEIRSMCGRFNWEPGYTFLGVNDEWEEVKEPVDFMTAIKSGRFIKVEHELITHCRYSDYERLDLLMLDLADVYAESDLTEILENGKWYIED